MKRDPSCIFCKIVAGEIPCGKVYEDNDYLAFRDINPQAPTHLLVVPKTHVARLCDCGEAEAKLLGGLLAAAAEVARREKLGDYRTVINCGEQAGQTVWHLHLHLLAGRAFGWPPG